MCLVPFQVHCPVHCNVNSVERSCVRSTVVSTVLSTALSTQGRNHVSCPMSCPLSCLLQNQAIQHIELNNNAVMRSMTPVHSLRDLTEQNVGNKVCVSICQHQ